MPTRAAVAIVATVAGVFLLFSFQPSGIPANATSRQLTPPAAATATPASGSGSTPGATATAATPTASSGYKNGTFTGQDFSNDYGDVQVAVVISGGRITDVQTIQIPMDRQRSAEISQAAAPILHDEVIQAQSAQIDTLSGATFTSEGYAQSVQSALDQARS